MKEEPALDLAKASKEAVAVHALVHNETEERNMCFMIKK